MQDEIDEVLRLVAQPLRLRNKLLNGECKFVLNSCLLFKINKVLDIFTTESVDIILSDTKRKQLQLLLHVLNNIPKLSISQRSAESFENVINLSNFKRLRYLELTRVCLHLVIGLDSLKTQLEAFICNRCTKYNGILSKQKELEWPELKFFNLRYMKLDNTSSGFFMNKPWIQTLDLSFNKLTVINGLDYLDHLIFLNVSFNQLEQLPKLSKDAENKLEILLINNNYISSLAGIEKLSALKHLDVNYNYITNKSEYLHLSNLKKLSSLNFESNPVSTIKYSNTYLASSLPKEINQEKFLLNNQPLSAVESFLLGKKFGTCKHWQFCNKEQPSTSTEIPAETRSQYRRPGKRISKPREVIIEDVHSDEVVKGGAKESLPKQDEILPIPVFSPSILETSNKENELMEQLSKLEIVGEKKNSYNKEPSPLKALERTVEEQQTSDGEVILSKEHILATNPQDSDVETTTLLINATVHAPDSRSIVIQNVSDSNEEAEGKLIDKNFEISKDYSDESIIHGSCSSKNTVIDYQLGSLTANMEEKGIPNEDSEISNLKPEDTFTKNIPQIQDNSANISDSEAENDQDQAVSLTDESDEVYSDMEDEVLWQVQSVDKATGRTRNILLVLMDNELKERSTETGRTMTRWHLHKIQSCSKTKIDPVTIELEFDTLKKDKQFRIYIMEYPDAQVLLKKVYSILESRPLSSMNQKTYECIKCSSFFVHNIPCVFKSRDSQVYCTVCSSTLVIEVEEPKLPEPQPPPTQAVSHSSSHSSIGKSNQMAEEAACTEWKSPSSAASLEQNSLLDRRFSTQKYESDIEVISNPSQSSIEVLGEHSRSVTPRRKISTEEKTGSVQAPTQLTTVMEVNSPFTNLTESSSSGSLTESVITAYEALNNNKKTIIPEGILAEEENSPASEQDPLSDGFEEEKPTSVWRKESDIYSFADFTDVDPRIKLYLYQSVFQDDNEALLLLVKCHLWRTGGTDFDGCAVFSTSKVYFMSHSKTNFKEDLCDWLSLFDSFNIKDIKEISPLIWQQGVRVQLKHISYLILVMDEERHVGLLKHMRGFLTNVKIQKNVNYNVELSLQQAVLSSSSIEKSADPTVGAFTICLSITIFKDDVEEEILRLGSLILTSGEFHVLPGDLSWLSTANVPSVLASQDISNLIEVEKGKYFVILHFLDEKEAIEEVWRFKLVSDNQVSYIVESIRTPWEQMFSEALDVTVHS